MSLENAKKFIERMKMDEAFKKKIMQVEWVADRLALANAEGYECTAEGIKSAYAELGEGELWCRRRG